MSDLLTTEEAAALWGCSQRNIQHYAHDGKLRVAQVVRSRNALGLALLFRPEDVLAARQQRRNTRKITARRNGVHGKTKLRVHRERLLRIWWTLPKSERTGRDWMRKAHKLWEAQKAQGTAYEL
jgi:hypothetical protein